MSWTDRAQESLKAAVASDPELKRLMTRTCEILREVTRLNQPATSSSQTQMTDTWVQLAIQRVKVADEAEHLARTVDRAREQLLTGRLALLAQDPGPLKEDAQKIAAELDRSAGILSKDTGLSTAPRAFRLGHWRVSRERSFFEGDYVSPAWTAPWLDEVGAPIAARQLILVHALWRLGPDARQALREGLRASRPRDTQSSTWRKSEQLLRLMERGQDERDTPNEAWLEWTRAQAVSPTGSRALDALRQYARAQRSALRAEPDATAQLDQAFALGTELRIPPQPHRHSTEYFIDWRWIRAQLISPNLDAEGSDRARSERRPAPEALSGEALRLALDICDLMLGRPWAAPRREYLRSTERRPEASGYQMVWRPGWPRLGLDLAATEQP